MSVGFLGNWIQTLSTPEVASNTTGRAAKNLKSFIIRYIEKEFSVSIQVPFMGYAFVIEP